MTCSLKKYITPHSNIGGINCSISCSFLFVFLYFYTYTLTFYTFMVMLSKFYNIASISLLYWQILQKFYLRIIFFIRSSLVRINRRNLYTYMCLSFCFSSYKAIYKNTNAILVIKKNSLHKKQNVYWLSRKDLHKKIK